MGISSLPPPSTDILVKTFFSSGEHVPTTGGKKFYQHTVTLGRKKEAALQLLDDGDNYQLS